MLEQQFRIKDAQIENNSRLVDQAKKEAMVQLEIKNYQKDFFHEGQLPSVRIELSDYIIM